MQCLTFRDILAEDRAEQLKRETDQVAQELERRLLANVSLCLLFIHPRAPNLISLRSAGTMSA